MNSKTFEDFQLDPSILRAVREAGYRTPTDVQTAGIPAVLAGRDLIATAETGTGKTAAFCLPILDMLHNRKDHGLRVLVLTPTRELALQIDASLRAYGRYLQLQTAVVLGGVPMHGQIRAIRRRPDILVATPGRLLDLVNQKYLKLGEVDVLVLDEADRMLDMGFIHDVRKIIAGTKTPRQTLLFSATLSSEIRKLASEILESPVSVSTAPPATVAVNVDQRVLFVDRSDKGSLLVEILKKDKVQRALVFTRTKHRADRVVRELVRHNITADAIHSNKSQNRRQRSLAAFDRGRIRVLVATDIMARGIDVEGISHVINFELPNEPENYVHRVGRTARAGAEGVALSFCDSDELTYLKAIERLIKHDLPTGAEHPYESSVVRSLHRQRHSPGPRPVGRRRQGQDNRFTKRPRRLAS